MSKPIKAQNSQPGPCQDFDEFINAKWKADNPVPASESRWGSFNVLANNIDKEIKGIFDELEKGNYPNHSYQQQLRDLYKSLLDTKTIENRGTEPLNKYFRAIDDAQSFNDLVVLSAIIPGLSLPVDGGVQADFKNSKYNTFYLRQSGLTLGDREYYLSDDADNVRIRTEYVEYIKNIQLLLGKKSKTAAKIANQIFNIEKDIATHFKPKEEMRDPMKIYNKFTYNEVTESAPTIEWNRYFTALGFSPNEIIVTNPDILKDYNKIIKNHSLNHWKEYMKFQFVTSMAPYLSSDFENEDFRFFSTVMSGVKEQKPMTEKTIRRINRLMGEPLGRMFVERYFPESSKEKVEHMIENMRSAFADRINALEWMSAETKKAALVKLGTFTYKIGYPTKWKDYSMLDIKSDRAFENVIQLKNFSIKENLEKYGKETDKERFAMNAHEVNAYYNPLFNEIVFPAGILQPPFFDPKADDAVNYGGIGAVIGHEFTHGFDDKGSQFDENGNLNNWWTEEDRTKFDALTKKLAKQYSDYEILPGVFINGNYTLGENIADQGGVTLGYHALMKEYAGKPEPPLVNGMTYKQRFFYGWADVWKNNSTDEAIRQMVATNPHSPAKARINVTLSNIKEFYEAFDCKLTKEQDESRVIVW